MRRCIWCVTLTLTSLMALLITATALSAASCPLGIWDVDTTGRSEPPGLTLTPPTTQHASISEVQALQARLQAIAPFIVRDRQGMQRVALADAFQAGVSAEAMVLGQRLVTLHNRLARSTRRLESSTMTASDFAFIAPLWRYEAQSGILSHCGSFADPTVCPAYVPSAQCFSTNDAAIEHLIAAGYHRTAIYAGGASGHDYTGAGPDPTCGSGPFRTQAVIAQLDSVWTYQTQGPEPNPEIFGAVPGQDDPYDYDWPHFWWGVYAFWWHAFFC
jgi:hypothetical protein